VAGIPTNPRDRNLLAVAALSIVALAAYWYLVWSPKNDEIVLTTTRVATLDSLNDLAKREMAKGNADELRAQAEQYRQNLDLMRQLVPTGNEVPALLDQVSTAARRAGLELSAVAPQPVIEGDQFDTYRYRMVVAGSYHRLAEFMTNVGSLPRIMAPTSVILTVIDQPSAAQKRLIAAGQTVLKGEFDLQTYVARSVTRSTNAGMQP